MLVAVFLPSYVDMMLMLVLTLVLVLILCSVASARLVLVVVSLPPYVDVDTFVGVGACVVASAVFVLACYTGGVTVVVGCGLSATIC